MIDVDAVAAAVEALPAVDRLGAGEFGEVATYLPGRRVHGVRTDGDHVEVHVVLRWQADLLAAADDVRSAVIATVDGDVDVDIIVADIVPEDADEAAGTEVS